MRDLTKPKFTLDVHTRGEFWFCSQSTFLKQFTRDPAFQPHIGGHRNVYTQLSHSTTDKYHILSGIISVELDGMTVTRVQNNALVILFYSKS